MFKATGYDPGEADGIRERSMQPMYGPTTRRTLTLLYFASASVAIASMTICSLRSSGKAFIRLYYTVSCWSAAVGQSSQLWLFHHDCDLDRYLEYIKVKASASRVKSAIRSFPAGKALVVLPDGEQISVQFHARESRHASNTPTVRDLMRRLQPCVVQTAPEAAAKGKKPRTHKRQPVQSPEVAAIHPALEHDSDLSPMELAARIGCGLELAKEARQNFFYGHLMATPRSGIVREVAQ